MKNLFSDESIEDILDGVVMYMSCIKKGQYIQKVLGDIYPEYSYTREEEKSI